MTMFKLRRRTGLLLFPLSTLSPLLLLASASPVQAQTAAAYPSKPIRLVVAFNAGGITDVIARLIGERLSVKLGQTVIVENQGGAGGAIATRQVAGSAADGYTVLVNTPAMLINAAFQKRPGYDVSTDFAPVAVAASTPNLYAVNASVKASSLKELATAYKGKPMSYGTAGSGSSSHLSAQYLLKNLMGLDVTHVPYRGGAPAVNAGVAAEVDVVSVSLPPALAQVKGGRLKPLAVAGRQRSEALPDVQTVIEAGFPDFEDRSWVGFFLPAKTDPAVVQRLNTAINEALAEPTVRERLVANGFDPQGGTAAQFVSYLNGETLKWARIVKATGITPE